MVEPARITSVQNPRIKAVVRLVREHRERRATGRFVAEGARQIARALAAGLPLRELYECPALPSAGAEIPWPQEADFAYFEVNAAVMGKMAYRQNPERLLAVFDQPSWPPELPPEVSLGSLRDAGRTGPDPSPRVPGEAKSELWLVAVGLTKPGNLGAMARTAAAAGATGLIVADGVVDPFNPNAIHASTGAVFTLPILAGSSAQVIASLKARGATPVALVVGATRPYHQVDLTRPIALIIGAEDTGLDEAWRQAAQAHGHCVSIPMAPSCVDSLNASNAAAIVLFEAVRQRNSVSSHHADHQA